MSEKVEKKTKKWYSLKEIKLKAAHFCAYQERSQQEVREKLYHYDLTRDEVEELLSILITEGFVNEERFAIAYAGGKFRTKQWGRIKIRQGLKQHKVSDYCINKGMEDIEEEAYINTLCQLIEKKMPSEKPEDTYALKHKIARYLSGKGYEPELVWKYLHETL